VTTTEQQPGMADHGRDAPMIWSGWGDPAERHDPPSSALRFLSKEIGATGHPTPPVPLAQVRVGASRLAAEDRAALAAAVGAQALSDDRMARILHAGGKSYPDLLRRRTGDALDAPDAVVWPGDHDEVMAVLRVCADRRIAVIPFGGGTSVVGGVEPLRGDFPSVISLDLSRMDRLMEVDRTSLIARFEPGARGRYADEQLAAHGLVLGHFPQSYEYASIGGYVATRSAGQASTGFGRIDDLVVGVRMATPTGELRLEAGPGSAAGPDLRALVLGSEGTLGVITEVSLRVRQRSEHQRYEAWMAPSFTAGAELLRRLVQADAAPDVARLSDEEETRTALAQQEGVKGLIAKAYPRLRGVRGGCLVILGWEGSSRSVKRRRAEALDVLRTAGAVSLGQKAGASWRRSRFHGPYLRDELMDRGVLVETLETATAWSDLQELYEAVRAALHDALEGRGTPPLVLCHISHIYPTGASLYFTFLARAEPRTALEQWRAAKTAASEAIAAQRATITHHHAVGTDHRPWMTDEVGPVGVEMLRALKERLDPVGVLNPGKLIPEPPG
jgi:alkyldihydroxyacetonephosphate synthase